jgi:AcrR family transcriptional regulator
VTNTTRRAPVTNLADRPKIGRPARIDRAMIARAAYEIGLDRVTMKAVADRLGVSVPGLYHHVEGRDDLMRLGAEYSAAQIQVPTDHGQHWTAWLQEWGHYSHDAFVAQPALLGQFLNGSLGVERMVTHVDAAIGVLTRQGFSITEAIDAYEIVSDCALGAAVGEIRATESARAGRPVIAEYHRLLATLPQDELPHLRKLVGTPRDATASFSERILTVLVGIAVRRGEPWQRIVDLQPVASEPRSPVGLMHS